MAFRRCRPVHRKAQELAREADGGARVVQARDAAAHARAVGRGARRAAHAGQPAPAHAFLLTRIHRSRCRSRIRISPSPTPEGRCERPPAKPGRGR
ncbi:hypothetical protein PT2222_210081 [Paraburkholderia tropica]